MSQPTDLAPDTALQSQIGSKTEPGYFFPPKVPANSFHPFSTLADAADLCLRTGLDPDILRSAFQVQARRDQPAFANVPNLDHTTRLCTSQISESDENTDEVDAITPVPRPRPRYLEPRAAQHLRPLPTHRTQRLLLPLSSSPSTEIPVIDLTSPEGPAAVEKRKPGEVDLKLTEAEAEAKGCKRHLADFFG